MALLHTSNGHVEVQFHPTRPSFMSSVSSSASINRLFSGLDFGKVKSVCFSSRQRPTDTRELHPHRLTNSVSSLTLMQRLCLFYTFLKQ